MIDVQEVLELHRETVARWHEEPIANNYEGIMQLVCQQHSFNFQLWHEEDIARSRDVTDAKIAEVKRNIDGFNQQRNDWIEKLDDCIAGWLQAEGLQVDTAPINTETPGSAIDRLSILSLRIYHMNEQLERDDASEEHKEKVRQKLDLCHEQRVDLSTSLSQLLVDLQAGTKRHKTYRQMKMYNDPSLNPYLYAKQLKKAA